MCDLLVARHSFRNKLFYIVQSIFILSMKPSQNKYLPDMTELVEKSPLGTNGQMFQNIYDGFINFIYEILVQQVIFLTKIDI